MLEMRGTRSGDFNFYTRHLEEDEKKYYGIFISHASADNDKYLYPLRDAMEKMGMYPLYDRDFLAGGDEYQSKIESTLDCYAAVIIVTEASLRSNWVNYELGILAGKKIPVFLWDPEGLFSDRGKISNPAMHNFSDGHFNPYLPAYPDMDSLLERLNNLSPYGDMFCEETEFIDHATFCARMKERVETVIVCLESDLFEEYYKDFADSKIGMLIPNFGMFYLDHGDGEHCFAKNRAFELENKTCPHSGIGCALALPRVVDKHNMECVLLNYLTYNGKIYRRGETDRRGKRIEKACFEFHMPVHRLYGTEFKIIIDVQNNARYDQLMAQLDEAGMNPTTSNSTLGGRIYLSLPERRAQGLFRLDHQFSNNFLCPHAARRQAQDRDM